MRGPRNSLGPLSSTRNEPAASARRVGAAPEQLPRMQSVSLEFVTLSSHTAPGNSGWGGTQAWPSLAGELNDALGCCRACWGCRDVKRIV